MKTKLLTIATVVALMLGTMTKVQAQAPCLPQQHGLPQHQSASCGVTQMLALTTGWNWISMYITVDDPIVLLDMLKEGLGNNALSIEGSNGMTEYLGDGFWMGDLDDYGISNDQLYLIFVENDCTVELQGTLVNPATVEITINPGPNWIGFPVSQEMEISNAFSNFAVEGDMVEGAEGMSEYLGDDFWMGFETMIPGQGYIYNSESQEVRTLTFPSGAKARHAYPNFGKIKKQPIEVVPTEDKPTH